MFAFLYDFCCSFVHVIISFFLKLIISVACYLRDSQNFFMQSLSLLTSCLFSIFSIDDIIDMEKPEGICLPTSLVD